MKVPNWKLQDQLFVVRRWSGVA